MRAGAIRLIALRCIAICGVAASLIVPSGCQVGRRWFQFDSNSRSPVMGLELRADAAHGDDNDDAGGTTLPVEHNLPEPRRGLRDWLGFPRGEERIPLPTTTDGSDEGVTLPLTGPRPEFE